MEIDDGGVLQLSFRARIIHMCKVIFSSQTLRKVMVKQDYIEEDVNSSAYEN